MGAEDWAIVVGIKSYFDPGLAGLEGPENDAREFYDWVVSADGGAVPKAQAQCILSSDYHPPFASAAAAMPTAEAIKGAVDHLRSIADANVNAENALGCTGGKRFYLFFSCHGVRPAADRNRAGLRTGPGVD